MRTRKPTWFYSEAMRCWTLNTLGASYFITAKNELKTWTLGFVCGGTLQYQRDYPTLALAQDAVDHGQGKKFSR